MHRNTALRNAGLWMLLSLVAGHLTEQQTSTIVDVHNDYRSQVRPSAVFMQKVVWDETLRLVAEAYAVKCIWDHNPELKSLKLGENLFVTTGPLNVTKAMLDWFEENHDYDYENNTCTEDKMCGHYTQMVWADSKKIGCAAHVCETLEGLDLAHKSTLVVCNYHPTGNYEGQRPYESGESCSKCPEELPVCEENICVKLLPSEEPPEDTRHPAISTEHPSVPPRTHEPTSVPEEPSSVPEEPSSVPEEPSSVPEEPTSVPEEPSSVPEEPSSVPEEPSSVPEEPTSVPEEPTSVPEEPSSVPEEPTQGDRKKEKTGIDSDIIKAGSEMERTLAPLLMLVWLSAAFIL